MKLDINLENLLKEDLIKLVKDLVEENDKLEKEIEELQRKSIDYWKEKEEYKKENEKLSKENLKYNEELHRIKMDLYAPNYRGAGRKNKFNEEQVKQIQEARIEGKSIRAIAKEFNCSTGLVHKLINKNKDINVKVIDIQDKNYVFTEYKSNSLEEALEKLKRVYGLEIDSFELLKDELKIYSYIEH